MIRFEPPFQNKGRGGGLMYTCVVKLPVLDPLRCVWGAPAVADPYVRTYVARFFVLFYFLSIHLPKHARRSIS